jgi:AraC-like DNA-binding protein
MDVLGDVLLSLRIVANSIGIFDFGAPWGFAMPDLSSHFACSLTAIEGPLWVESTGQPRTLLEPGDTILILNGSRHRYMSAPDVTTLPLPDFLRAHGVSELGPRTRREAPVKVTWGDGPVRTRLLTLAFIVQDPARSPLLAALPNTILLRNSGQSLLPWIPATVSFLAEEDTSALPGYVATASRLAELIFTSFLRAHLVSDPPRTAGWIRGLSDPNIGRALAGIHSRPTEPWTATRLAQEAGMARSTFAKRFAELLGRPPIDYLIAFRLQLACDLLLAGRHSISALAEASGYQSERAFRQAFKDRFGMAPKRYLKSVRSQSQEDSAEIIV